MSVTEQTSQYQVFPRNQPFRNFWQDLLLFVAKVVVVVVAITFLGMRAYELTYMPLYSNLDTCNVEVVPITGTILSYGALETTDETGVTYADDSVTTPSFVGSELSRLSHDDTVLGVIAFVDAPGGAPAASEQVMKLISAFDKPIVAQGGDMMTSGGYLAALGADRIVASSFTDVGSIGVTYSYVDNVKKNEQEGLNYNTLSSGPYKDYGDPNRPLTDAERALIERDIAIYHNHFIEQVASARGLSVDEVRSLADGSSMPSSLALEKNLIDAIGGEREALLALSDILDVSVDSLEVCR